MNGLFRRLRASARTLKQDLSWAQRSLRRSRAFTIMAVFVAAMGIGANTAAFTLLDYVLLRPLPFTDPERLVRVYQTQLANGYTRMVTSPANFEDWRKMSKSFEAMGAYSEVSVNMSGEAEPQRLRSMQITEDVLHVLGVRPALGRDFTAYDYELGTPDVALLSHGLAKTMYGDPAKALNRTIYLDHRPFIVVGVMPADFAFPSREAQLWQPLVFAPLFPEPRAAFQLFPERRRAAAPRSLDGAGVGRDGRHRRPVAAHLSEGERRHRGRRRRAARRDLPAVADAGDRGVRGRLLPDPDRVRLPGEPAVLALRDAEA